MSNGDPKISLLLQKYQEKGLIGADVTADQFAATLSGNEQKADSIYQLGVKNGIVDSSVNLPSFISIFPQKKSEVLPSVDSQLASQKEASLLNGDEIGAQAYQNVEERITNPIETFRVRGDEALERLPGQTKRGFSLLTQNTFSVPRQLAAVAKGASDATSKLLFGDENIKLPATGFSMTDLFLSDSGRALDEKLDQLRDNALREGVKDLQEREVNPNTTRSVKDIRTDKVSTAVIDAINLAVGFTADAAPQILTSIGTLGIGSFALAADETYTSAVMAKAKAEGISPEEVIDNGLDQEAVLAASTIVSGGLDMLGAKGVSKTIRKGFDKTITGTLRRRGKEFLKDIGKTDLKEGLTELGQFVTNEVSSSIESGEPLQIDKEKGIEALDNFLAGVFGSGGIRTATNVAGTAKDAFQAHRFGDVVAAEERIAKEAPNLDENVQIEDQGSAGPQNVIVESGDGAAPVLNITSESKRIEDSNNRLTALNEAQDFVIKGLESGEITQDIKDKADEANRLSKEGQEEAKKFIKNDVSVEGVDINVTGVEGVFDLSSEGSAFVEISTNDSNKYAEALNKFADLAEKRSQDSFLEHTKTPDQELSQFAETRDAIGKQSEDGAHYMPSLTLNFTRELDNVEKIKLKKLLKDNGFDGATIFDDKANIIYWAQGGQITEDVHESFGEVINSIQNTFKDDGVHGSILGESQSEIRKVWEHASDQAYEDGPERGYSNVRANIAKRFPESNQTKTQPEGGQTVANQEEVITEDAARPPPNIPIEETKTTDKQKKRKFPKQLLKDKDLRPEVKEGLTDDVINYTPISNDYTQKEVNAIIETKGTRVSESMVLNASNRIPLRTRVQLGETLIKKLNKEISEAPTQRAKDEALNSTIEIASSLAKLGTELGRGIQAFAVYKNLDPEAFVIKYIKAKNEAIKSLEKSNKKSGKKKPKKQKPTSRKKLTKKQVDDKLQAAIDKFKKGGGFTTGGLTGQRIEALAEIGYYLVLKGIKQFKDWANEMRKVTGEANLTDKELAKIWESAKTPEGVTLKELAPLDSEKNIEKEVQVAEEKGVPKEMVDKIRKMANEIKHIPEGSLRDEHIVDIMSEILTDIEKTDPSFIAKVRDSALLDLWYASILSGWETQALNFGANVVNLLLEGIGSSLVNVARGDVDSAAATWYGVTNGFQRGGRDFVEILKHGKSSTKLENKWFANNALERKNGILYLNHAAKYVPRFMGAVDALFYAANSEMKYHEIAARLAKEEGLSGKKLRDRASEFLYKDNIDFDKALIRANRELDLAEVNTSKKFNESARKKRAFEIIEQGRSNDFQTTADRYGRFATFNYEPVGVLGAVADSIAKLGQTLPPVRLIVPFTRIVANVLNQQIDYTPYGALRASGLGMSDLVNEVNPWGKKIKSSRGGIEGANLEDVYRQYYRAVVGTIGMSILFALISGEDEDEKNPLNFHGSGPRNKAKRSQWFEQGNKPYSFNGISYQYTPLGFAFSLVGNYNDAIKYKNLGKTDAGNRFAYALTMAPKAMLDMSFLQGLQDFFGSMQRDVPTEDVFKKGLSGPVRIASSFVPNLFKQIDKLFDPTLYSNDEISEMFIRDIPFARQTLKPKLNMFGEPIRKRGNRFYVKKNSDPTIKFMAENKLWVSGLGETTQIDGTVVTSDQYYSIVKNSGPKIKQFIKKNMSDWKKRLSKGDISKKRIQSLINTKTTKFRAVEKNKLKNK